MEKASASFFLLAEIATTSDNVSMLPYNRSYYLRAPHLLRVGRSPTLPRIGRVPQCARFTHFGGWYVIRSITAPSFERQADTALFLALPIACGRNEWWCSFPLGCSMQSTASLLNKSQLYSPLTPCYTELVFRAEHFREELWEGGVRRLKAYYAF